MINLNHKIITKTFEKKNVIETGEHLAKKRKVTWLVVGIVALGIILSYDIVFFVGLIGKTLASEEIYTLVLQNVSFIGFGIFAIIFSRLKKYDSLLLGCKSVRWNENEPLRESRRNERKAKKNNKANYVRKTSSFNMDELYGLLCVHDVVKYSWNIDVDIAPVSTGSSPSTRKNSFGTSDYNSDDHHFDSKFTDEEFDDLMD